MLTVNDLKRGHVYSAKKPQAGVFNQMVNDRQILHINLLEKIVQYDSPTIRIGRKYPKVSIDAFLKWADKDITDQLQANCWRTLSQLKDENERP